MANHLVKLKENSNLMCWFDAVYFVWSVLRNVNSPDHGLTIYINLTQLACMEKYKPTKMLIYIWCLQGWPWEGVEGPEQPDPGSATAEGGSS